jgi:hypothetical protein
LFPQHADELWVILDEASRRASNYDLTDNRQRWERYIREALTLDKPITIATVFKVAKSAGWQGWTSSLAAVNCLSDRNVGGTNNDASNPQTSDCGGLDNGTNSNSRSNSEARPTSPDQACVLYTPGNEEACRRALDRVVAADERVFTLEGSGLLAILRVPETKDQASGVQWDGDLPATTLATPADIVERAERYLAGAGENGDSAYPSTAKFRG